MSKSQRLTNYTRTKILNQESQRLFHDKIQSLKKQVAGYINDMISARKPKELTDEVINTGFVFFTNNYNIAGFNRDYNSQGICEYDCFNTMIRGLINSQPCYLHRSHKIEKDEFISEIFSRYLDLINQEKEFKSKMSSVLNSYRTEKRLAEDFPELIKYLNQAPVVHAVVSLETLKEIKNLLKK